MRLPGRKTTVYAVPDALARPRLGITPTHAQVGERAPDVRRDARALSGIARIPGYLNMQLLTSIMLDSPPHLRMDVEFPPIALLMAAYNEEQAIAETLDFALRSDYPGSFEVVVVDDGSQDRTREIV